MNPNSDNDPSSADWRGKFAVLLRRPITKGLLAAVVAVLLLLGLVGQAQLWADPTASTSDTATGGQDQSPQSDEPPVSPSSHAGADSGQYSSGTAGLAHAHRGHRHRARHEQQSSTASSSGGVGSSSGSGSSIAIFTTVNIGSVAVNADPTSSWKTVDEGWTLNGKPVSDPSRIRIVPGDTLIHRANGTVTTNANSLPLRVRAATGAISGDPNLASALGVTTTISDGWTTQVLNADSNSSVTVSNNQQLDLAVRVVFNRNVTGRFAQSSTVSLGDTTVYLSTVDS